MRLDYITSAVQGLSPINDFADFCLTPVRTLFEDHTYQVIYARDGSIDEVHVVAQTTGIAANKVFALLLIVIVIPLAIGLLLKVVVICDGTLDEYVRIEEVINSYGKGTDVRQQWAPIGKGYAIDPEGLARVPTPIKAAPSDDPVVIEAYPLTKFLQVWDEVGSTRGDYRARRDALEYWLTSQVPYENQYTHIASDQVPAAKIQLGSELRGILQAFDSGSTSEVREWAIIKLIDGAAVCSPTWLEETHEVYQDLLSGSFEDKALRVVQKFKENILKYIVQHVKHHQWHSVNPFRYQNGAALGLVMDNLDNDSAYNRATLVLTVQEFLNEYHVDRLICFVVEELNHAKRSDQIADFLAEVVKQNDDPAQYVREHFFRPLSQNEFALWLNRNPRLREQYEGALRNVQTVTADPSSSADDIAFAESLPKMLALNARTQLNIEGATAILHHLGVIREGGGKLSSWHVPEAARDWKF